MHMSKKWLDICVILHSETMLVVPNRGLNSRSFIANELVLPHFALVRQASPDALRQEFPRCPGKFGKIEKQECVYKLDLSLVPKLWYPPSMAHS